MSPSFVYLSILFLSLIVIGELSSVTRENARSVSQKSATRNTKHGLFFPTTRTTKMKYRRINDKHSIKNSTNFSKSNTMKRLEERRSRLKTEKSSKIMRESELRKINSTFADESGENAGRGDFENEEKKSIAYYEEQSAKFRRKKKNRIVDNQRVSRNKSNEYFSTKMTKQLSIDTKQLLGALNVSCPMTFAKENSLSLRNLFHVPRVHGVANCSGQTRTATRMRDEYGPSSDVSIRSIDRGHTDLINQYETEQSMDGIGVEYVHPEGHYSRSPRRKILARSVLEKQYTNDPLSAANADDDSNELDYSFSKRERPVRETIFKNRREFAKEDETRGPRLEKKKDEELKKHMKNSSSHISPDSSDAYKLNFTVNPWPLVPGPISCDLDFQLQPSFVAKLGEFDYVVSVQLQRNPDEPAEHACTGVVYNRRFIVIAPHCLNDNYGLTVTSTDDLCTIDEIIDVDYIIEHENYDPETRRNDIALIKLKSEIHKRSAALPSEDDGLGKYFYAVGFGELMWNSFPNKVSKLLQKLPVQRYPQSIIKEVAGTLHVTTSHMDLTGAFRGDFGGALINLRGEFIGLKSKFVKRSTEFEVYTRVRAYLPWIKSMVALHGSW